MIVVVDYPVVLDALARPDNHKNMMNLLDVPPECENVLANCYCMRTMIHFDPPSQVSGGVLPDQYVSLLVCACRATGQLLDNPHKQPVMSRFLHERTRWCNLQPLLY